MATLRGGSLREVNRTEWRTLNAISDDVGQAFYVYDQAALRHDIDEISSAVISWLPNARFHYAYKANFAPDICRTIAAAGWGAEVDSPMLLWLARRIGVPAELLTYNGIAREPDTVRDALLSGVLVCLDAGRDVDVALQTARESPDANIRVAIRINSTTDIAPTPRLGRTHKQLKEAVAALANQPGIDLLGLSVHRPDRSPEGVRGRMHDLIAMASDVFPEGPRILDIGGALSAKGVSINSAHATSAQVIREALDTVSWGDRVTILIESGAAAVAGCMNYVARVVDIAEQPGRTVINVAGSVFHTSPNTRRVDFPVRVVTSSPRGQVQGLRLVGGGMAVDGDWLSVDLPSDTDVREGDFLIFEGVGAYSISMGTHFTEPLPAIVERTDDGWRVLRRQPTFAETLAGFNLDPE